MKEIFQKYSAFTQVIIFVGIGAVGFVLTSVVANLLVHGFYPSIPTSAAELVEHYPIQFILLNYLPFQVGFLFIPGIIYWRLTDNLPSKQQNLKKYMALIWALLLFSCVFLLLPFFTQINTSITSLFGATDALEILKAKSDQQMAAVVGKVGSVSFYLSLVVVGLITGIGEELAFRRFLCHHLLNNTKKIGLSIFASAFIFALLHFNYIQFIPLFAFGTALAMIYLFTQKIIPGIIFHALNNCINIYWLAGGKFPSFLENVNIPLTIVSLVVLLLVVFYFYKNRKSMQSLV